VPDAEPPAACRPWPDVVVAGWEPVRGPYRALREPLAAAEQRLNDTSDTTRLEGWRQLRDAVGNDQACDSALDRLLAALLHGWRVIPVGERWRVALIGQPGAAAGDLAAVQALALLVESASWSRLKRCPHQDCSAVFLDWTNPGNRRHCRAHRPPVGAPTPAGGASTTGEAP